MGIFTKALTTIARGLGLTSPQLLTHYAGGSTDSGETVTVDSSLQLGTVWACVRLIAETMATLPLQVHRKTDSGHSEVVPDHPLTRVQRIRPNYEMTAVDFWVAVISAYLLWGNAYIWIRRVGARITALYPMRPDHVTRRRELDGSLTYTFVWEGQTITLGEADVLHVKGFSLDGLVGISLVAIARNSMGAARAAERASSAIFRNGLRPSGVLTAPTYLTEPQREDAKTILSRFRGANEIGGVPLLEGGWKFDSLAIPPEDAQLLETRSFHVEELCRWFDVPPIMVGHSDKQSSGAVSVDSVMRHFHRTCLRKHIVRVENSLQGGLITPADDAKGFFIRYNVEGLLRADEQARSAYYTAMVQNGLMTRNEVRRLENLPEMDGGDELTVQSNLLPIEDLAAAITARQPSALPGRQNGSAVPIPEIRQ